MTILWRPLRERFMEKFVVDESGCWLWTARIRRDGYGQIGAGGGKGRTLYAHRVAYELLVGPIPEHLTLDHLCRRRECVNPEHLELVTMRENILRGETPAAANLAKRACPQGHPYAGSNLRITPQGYRVCRTCTRDAMRRHRAKKRMSAGPE